MKKTIIAIQMVGFIERARLFQQTGIMSKYNKTNLMPLVKRWQGFGGKGRVFCVGMQCTLSWKVAFVGSGRQTFDGKGRVFWFQTLKSFGLENESSLVVF